MDFSIIHDKSLEVMIISCCPTMDLLAVVTRDGQIAIFRTISWQRLLLITKNDLPSLVTTLVWSPDGKVLASGHENGSICHFDMDSGQMDDNAFVTRQHHDCAITAMHWTIQMWKATTSSFRTYEDRTYSFLPPPPPLTDNHMYSNFEHKPTHELPVKKLPQVLDILISGDAHGKVVFQAYGQVHLGTIHLQDILPVHLKSTYSIKTLLLSSDFSCLLIWSSSKDHSSILSRVNTTCLSQSHAEIRILSQQFIVIEELIAQIRHSIEKMQAQWRDSIKVLDIKLKLLSKALIDDCCDSTPVRQLFTLATCGTASITLAQFLSNNLNEQGLLRMKKTFESSTEVIEKLLNLHVSVAGESILFRLAELRGLSAWKERFQDAGLETKLVDQTLVECQRFLLKTEELLVLQRHVYTNFSLLFRWFFFLIRDLGGSDKVSQSVLDVADKNHLISFLRQAAQEEEEKKSNTTSDSDGVFGNIIQQYLLLHPLKKPYPKSFANQKEDDAFRYVSLATQAQHLENSWKELLKSPEIAFNQRFSLSTILEMKLSFPLEKPCAMHFRKDWESNDPYVLVASNVPSLNKLILLKIYTKHENKMEWMTMVTSKKYQQVQMDFYGEVIGAPFTNEEKLCLGVRDQVTQEDMLATLIYDEINFFPLLLGTHEKKCCIDINMLKELPSHVIEFEKFRSLPQRRHYNDLVACGSRGIVCIRCSPLGLIVLDVEEDQETLMEL